MRGIEQYLQVDAATLGALKYQGTWDASTNTPTLTSSVGVQGQYYVVSVAGSTNLNGETNWQVGDWAVFNGSVWQKVDGGSTGLLTTLTVTGNTYLATTSGSVGVGTSSPGVKLDVSGGDIRLATNATYYRSVTSGGTSVRMLGINAGNVAYIGPIDSGPTDTIFNASSTSTVATFYTSGAERMRITSAGDVGIGTTSPGAKLSVVGTAKVGEGVASNTSKLMVNTVSGVAAGIQLFQDATESWIIQNPASTTALTFSNSGTERMRIDSSGNVGIGTSSPLSPLHVKGTTNGNLLVRAASSAASGLTGLGLSSINDAASDVADMALQAKNFNFVTDNTVRATLDSSGNLGLGVTPSASNLASFQSPYGMFIGNNEAHTTKNAYYSSGWKYVTTAVAARFAVGEGGSDFRWYTAPSGTAGNTISFTQAMTLTSTGDFHVARTTTADTTVGVSLFSSGTVTCARSSSSDADLNLYVYSTGASAARFYVGMGGTVYATNTTISAISDQRFKENIQDLDVGLDKIMALKPRKFDWKEGKGKNIKGDRGFVAQEFEQIFPDLVDKWADPAPEGEDPYKSVRQDLIPVLVKAIQEQQAIIESLKARLDAANL